MGSENDLIHAGHEGGLYVNFACPNPDCHNVLEEVVEDAVFGIRVERISDGIDYAETKVLCGDCGSEYEVVVLVTPTSKKVMVQGFPSTHVEFSNWDAEDEYDNFLSGYNPVDPFGVYNATVIELDNLQHGSQIIASAVPAFNKMICLQHIIAIEAYLSDRLIKIVINDNEKLLALVGATPALRDLKPKLIDIAKEPNFVSNTAKDYLQRFSFHDLASVAGFYKAVLKIDIFDNEANEREMLDIIKMRHDLVHRSGRDNEGKDVTIDDDHITILKDLMRALVTRVEAAHHAYTAARYFARIS